MSSKKYPSFLLSASTIFSAQLSASSSDMISSKLFLMDVSGQKSSHNFGNEKSEFINSASTFCANTCVLTLSISDMNIVPVFV
jgi:hypothetical protein